MQQPSDTSAAVCVIGAANVDLAGHSDKTIVIGESNPGRLQVSFGGVGRNIAENLARLGCTTHLVTVLGDDPHGQQLLAHARDSGIQMHAHIVAGQPTPAYLCINDAGGELVVAVAAMELLACLDVRMIEDSADLIRSARLCVIDANLDPALIGYLLETFDDHDFLIDTVSAAKAVRLRPWLGQFAVIKLNRSEAEQLCGVGTDTHHGLQSAAAFLLEHGTGRVLISLGDEGLFFADANHSGWLRGPPLDALLCTTGAGDAMMAGLVAALLAGQGLEQAARQALAAATLTLECVGAVNPAMSLDALHDLIEGIEHV